MLRTRKPLAYNHRESRWPNELERRTGDRTVEGSNPTADGTLAIPFTPLCQCLSEETLKAVGPFYLVSICQARGSKIPHQFPLDCVTVVDSTAHSKLPQKCIYAAENAALHYIRRRRIKTDEAELHKHILCYCIVAFV